MSDESSETKQGYKYQVALSFAGEERGYVEAVADKLHQLGIACFLDSENQVALWGKNLVEYLEQVYLVDSEYVVVFISSHYAAKQWTRHELRSAMARALKEKNEYILPARFDDTHLEGLLDTVAYIDLRRVDPETLASFIAGKVRQKAGLAIATSPSFARTRDGDGKQSNGVDRLASVILEYSADPAKEAVFARMLIDEARRIVTSISEKGAELVLESKEDVELLVASTAQLVGSFSNALAKLSYFGGVAQARFVSDSIERIGQACLNQERLHPNGGLGFLPATIISYGAACGASLSENMDLLALLLLKPRLIVADSARVHWATQFNTLTTFGRLEDRKLLPGDYIKEYGGGLLVRNTLEALPFAQLASCADRFGTAFEIAEYAIGLVCESFGGESTLWSVPAGTLIEYFSWKSDDRGRKALLESIAESGLRRALQECRPYGIETARLEKADTDFESALHARGERVR